MNREELIMKTIENACNAEERARVEQLLQEDETFRAELEEQQTIHAMLGEEPLFNPDAAFSQAVMSKLSPGPNLLMTPFFLVLFGLVFLQILYFTVQQLTFFPIEYSLNPTYLVYGMITTIFLLFVEFANLYFSERINQVR